MDTCMYILKRYFNNCKFHKKKDNCLTMYQYQESVLIIVIQYI